MDYFEGVVSEFLRADRTMFINTQFLLQIDDVEMPAKDRHWYCDAVALSFKDSTIYLCEISYSSTLIPLMRRLLAWAKHWPELKSGMLRDAGITLGTWEIQPWVFIPQAGRERFEKKLSAGLAGPQPSSMPYPRITELESILPWKYRSWSGRPYKAAADA